MSGIPDTVADVLVAEVKRRKQWDEPPCIYLMHVNGGRCRLAPLPLPDAAWAAVPPAQVLAALAGAVSSYSPLLQAAARPGLFGAAFRCEMWQVQASYGDHAAIRAMVTDGNARRVHARPDRVEVRQIWAVDRSRVSYLAGLERGSGGIQRIITQPDPGRDFVGTIPAALDRIVSALLGVSMPGRSLKMD